MRLEPTPSPTAMIADIFGGNSYQHFPKSKTTEMETCSRRVIVGLRHGALHGRSQDYLERGHRQLIFIIKIEFKDPIITEASLEIILAFKLKKQD
jgi:hypothetical protein